MMKTEELTEDASLQENHGYQVMITGIKWDSKTIGQYYVKHDKAAELPQQFTLDLPENVLAQAKKKMNEFNDVVESFIYNFLTRKFGHEVNRCQVWLPLED